MDQWTVITQMNSLRSGFGLTAYAGKIYAVSTKTKTNPVCAASEVRFSVPAKLRESEMISVLANANFCLHTNLLLATAAHFIPALAL